MTITLSHQHVVCGRAYTQVTIDTSEQYLGTPSSHVRHVLTHPNTKIVDFRGVTVVTLVEHHAGVDCTTTLTFYARDQVELERVVECNVVDSRIITLGNGDKYYTQENMSVTANSSKIVDFRAIFTSDNTIECTGLAKHGMNWMLPFKYHYALSKRAKTLPTIDEEPEECDAVMNSSPNKVWGVSAGPEVSTGFANIPNTIEPWGHAADVASINKGDATEREVVSSGFANIPNTIEPWGHAADVASINKGDATELVSSGFANIPNTIEPWDHAVAVASINKGDATEPEAFDEADCQTFVITGQYYMIYKGLLYETGDQSMMSTITEQGKSNITMVDGRIRVTNNDHECVFARVEV